MDDVEAVIEPATDAIGTPPEAPAEAPMSCRIHRAATVRANGLAWRDRVIADAESAEGRLVARARRCAMRPPNLRRTFEASDCLVARPDFALMRAKAKRKATAKDRPKRKRLASTDDGELAVLHAAFKRKSLSHRLALSSSQSVRRRWNMLIALGTKQAPAG
jgi:hypothetical protein